MSTRICLDCEQPGDYAQVHADGTMDGWRCSWCDYRLICPASEA